MKGGEEFLNLDTARSILGEILKIPSAADDDKNAILDFVLEYLSDKGLECEKLNAIESPALISPGSGDGILLSGHLDTVPIGSGWTREQGQHEGSVLFGRGAADMKGGCVAMIIAAAAMQQDQIPVSLAFTTDEESGMKGAEEIAKIKLIPDAAAIIVCEPTSLRVGVRERGLLQLGITTFGDAAHSAMPEEGDNAIHRMLGLLENVRSALKPKSGEFEDLILNIDLMRGGEMVNVLPSECRAEIDIRTPVEVSPEEVLEIIENKIGGFEHSLEIINQLEPVIIPEDTDIVVQISKLRPGAERFSIAFATEMIKYFAGNRNIVACGPGDPRLAHTADEHIDVREVLQAAELYYELGYLLKSR